MKYCTNCGALLEDDAIFCTACGTKQAAPNLCPHCGYEHEPDAAFCTNCGQKLPPLEPSAAASTISTPHTVSSPTTLRESTEAPKNKVGAAVFIMLLVVVTIGAAYYFFGDRVLSFSSETEVVNIAQDSANVAEMPITPKEQPSQEINEPVVVMDFFENVYSGDDYYEAVKSMVENNFSPEAQQQLRDLNDYEGQDDYAIWKIDGSSDGGCPSDKRKNLEYCNHVKYHKVILTFEMYDSEGGKDGMYDIVYECHYDYEQNKVIVDKFEIIDATL